MKVFRSYFNKINNTKIKLPFPIIDIYIFKWNKISQTGKLLVSRFYRILEDKYFDNSKII